MNTTTTLPPRTPAPLPQEVVHAMALRNSYIWVLVGVGLPGNLACLVTVLSMPVTTATFYVALLAAADSVALLVKLLFHQLVTHAKLTKAACIFLNSPTFFGSYANWVLALICFERFVAVCFPLKKQVFFTKRRVYISVVVLTLALAVCFSPTPFFYSDVRPRRTRCTDNPKLLKFKKQFFEVFRSCLYFFIPFLLVAVFTTLIIVGLQRHRRARQRMSMARTGGNTGNDGNVERSISIMLLCAGLVFLLLTLPTCLYHLFLEKLFDLKVKEESAQAYLLYQITSVLVDINHAVNFIIYFLSAAKFRKRFMELVKRCLCCARCKVHSGHSEDVTHLTHVSHSKDANNTQDSTEPA